VREIAAAGATGAPGAEAELYSRLITDGPYRFSRNPGYVSLTMLYLGLGILLDNGWVLILVVPVLVVMDRWVIRREDRHLEARFGDDFRRYRARVRRWLWRRARWAPGLRETRAQPTGGRRAAHGRACSNAAEAWSTVRSAKRRPTIWRPTGRPSGVKPAGTDAAGWPVKLNG
jgi:hypothetical protein